MSSRKDQLMVILKKGKQRLIAKTPLPGVSRVIVVVNRQYTNAPSTTQIASGAGHSSAAGSNAAIRSPYVRQQQSVGAGGKAFNKDGKGGLMGGRWSSRNHRDTRGLLQRGKEVVIVVNDQVVKLPRGQQTAGATQVASGGGRYSTGGTNSAISSPGTRQQHAVGGGSGSVAANKYGRRRHKKHSHKRRR
ncbi:MULTISPECIES: hypothetical protein [Paenibacillus]|uniref:hypothetical protein n=1 Tax=Paenibacillus TaxID=44249 RepID=UPI0004B6A615|nr:MULTISPECIES: hypothetical protein [Paenibacillus]SMF22833.1 hypothetical protein SAMN02744102_02084 [Paenibacillus barengoltzii]